MPSIVKKIELYSTAMAAEISVAIEPTYSLWQNTFWLTSDLAQEEFTLENPMFYKATKLPDSKARSVDCVIVLRKQCYAMGKVEVADLKWFPLS
ncbi:hypothetical protein T01_892 [Trichinella spiralis]|uniref:Uncharacterized protein n=1 Tax=Trichinella spiralis TaxID=6334 RepID=A0A0V1AKY6_TRISP|nr:hypothetical protein T01_892 [Trichinella spiralis]